MNELTLQIILLIAITLLYTLQNLFSRLYTDNYPGNKDNASPIFAAANGVAVPLCALFFSGFSFSEFNYLTLIFGLSNAVILFFYYETLMKASATGSYSIMMVFNVSGGIIIPAIASSVFFGAPLSWVKMVAIAVIVAAVYMVTFRKTDGDGIAAKEGKSQTALFLIVCTALAISNGVYAALFDAQRTYATADSQGHMMIIYTFGGAGLLSLIRLFITRGRAAISDFRQTKISLAFMLGGVVVSALAANVLVLLLELKINMTLMVTFDNAGVMVLSALASVFIFREKLSPLNVAGLSIMTAALVLSGASNTVESFLAGLIQ